MRNARMARVAGLVTVATVLAPAGLAHARTGAPVWACRASASYTTINGGDRAETIVANGNVNTAKGKGPDHALCASGEAGGGNLPSPLGVPPDLLSAPSASAVTTIDPELGESSSQRVTALGRVDDLALRLPQGGTVVVGATTAVASAAAQCAGGSPQLTGSGKVVGLTLGGAPIDADALAARLAAALSGTALVKVATNETIRTPESLTVRALHLVVRQGTSTIVDTVIAEAKVGFDGAVCDPPPTSSAARVPKICPAGSEYVPERDLCIIRPSTSGPSLGDIIVGPPGSGLPSGGRLIPLDVARRRYNSRCLTGRGNKYVQVGTKRSDRMRGSLGRDRILGFGGEDEIDGTSGNDCLDGGRGGDKLVGGLGSDRSFGGSGNDRFNGGPGNDYLVGDAGRDTMNAGYGADRVFGGAGPDAINIATAGRAASADCGSGRDKVRLNRNERRRVHGCETRYTLPDP